MAINIDTLVHNEFGRSATDHLATLIGKPTAQVKSGVERAVTEVLDGFSLMARDESGRQTIYEATRYCDDGLLDDPELFHRGDERAAVNESNSALGTLLGAGNRDSISESVRSASGLSADDADTITGYVTPGVLAVMKRQLLNGAVLDNSDGIGQMLLGETTVATPGGAIESVDHSVPKSAPRQTNTPGNPSASGAAAATAHSEGADMSWLFRWMLPLLLLGGLLLGGLRNCAGNNVTAPVAAVDTGAQFEAQIAGLTAERDEALSDRETAVAEIERLRGELAKPAVVAEPDTTELDAANAEIDRLKAEMAEPADTSELDAANAEIARLNEEMAKPADTSELDAANAEIAQLKEEMAKPADTSELDAANAEIARLNEELAKPADTSEVDAANAEISQLKEQLANQPDNSDQILSLQQMVDDSGLKFAQLESELGTVRDSRDELEGSLAGLRAEKENAENNLQTAKATNDGLTEERDALQAEVDNLKVELEQLGAERDKLVESTAQLTDERDNAMQATEQETAKIGVLNSNIGGLENQLASLSAARDKITGEADDLKDEISSLEDKISTLDGDLAKANSALEKQQQDTAAVEAERDDALAKIDALESDLGSAVDDASNQREITATALNDIDELKKSLSASADENSSLKKMVEGRDAFSALQRKKIAALKSTQDNTNGLVADLEGMLDGAQTDLGVVSQDKKDLEQSIQKAEALVQAEKDRVVALSDELSEMLSAAGVSSANVQPIDDNQAVSISMGSTDLYRVGSATLSQQGSGVLETVGGIVSEYKDWRVDVEGHTDSQGIGSALRNTYPTNWELSVARAAAAVRVLQNQAGISAEQLSARGFGEHIPVASNDTPEGREANRRVELILRPTN